MNILLCVSANDRPALKLFNGDWATGTERSEFPIAQSTIFSKGISP